MQVSDQSSQLVSYMMRNNRVDLRVSGLNFPENSSVCLYQRTAFTRQNWIMFGATEEISGTGDPVFERRFMIIYFFSGRQDICAEIIDNSTHRIVGKACFVLADLFTAPNQVLSVTVQKESPAYSKQSSFLIIKAEHFTDCLDEVKLKFSGSLTKNIFGSRTLITLLKQDQQKRLIQVARTDVYSGETPLWNPIQVSLMHLCEKDYKRPLKLMVHKVMKEDEGVKGSTDFTLEELFSKNVTKLDLLEFTSKSTSPSKKKVGTILIESKEIIPIPQFVDFVFGGLEICTSIGIDFSNKGGSHSDLNSQHYFNEGLDSRCESTLKFFTEVLSPYNQNKEVACFGFGATLQASATDDFYDTYSSCFLLTNETKSNLFSDPKLLKESYRRVLKQIEPHQIRFITPVVETMVSNIKKDLVLNSKARYYIIIVFLEEDIEDIQELIDYMVFLNERMAITLILIGMGKGPYPSMDGFNAFSGSRMPFYDTKGNVLESNAIIFLTLQETKGLPAELVKDVLKFIPDRVLLSMMKNHLLPHQLRITSDIGISKGETTKRFSIESKLVDDLI